MDEARDIVALELTQIGGLKALLGTPDDSKFESEDGSEEQEIEPRSVSAKPLM